ncbi:hypothetical protein PMG11_11009 [Penicillium brasilianum]|uniref:Cyanovirin-N domain-containing protein n=1 Tax=Penicillium brasilianum TaxID=104259 RepID=A0A0F7U553_PENBI|nr:hypothetical protein PMG11_11009 [Penicillium brasilianum]
MVYINFPKILALFLGSIALSSTVSADYMTDWCQGIQFINDGNFMLMWCQNTSGSSTFPLLVVTNPGNCIGNDDGVLECGSGFHKSCTSTQWSLNSYSASDDGIYIDPTIIGVCTTAAAKKRLSQVHVNDCLSYNPFDYTITCT